MPVTVKDMVARRAAAKRERDAFQPLLDEAYEFAIPYRKGISRTGPGEKRTNRIFDHTAILSAFRSSSRIAQDISPAGEQNFELTPGPLAKVLLGATELEELTRLIEPIKTVAAAHFLTGEWDNALAEMALDLMAGTGAMLIVPDKRRRIARFVAAPLEEVMATSGPYNYVNGIFWERKWTLRAIAEEFSEDNFVLELAKIHKEKPETEVSLFQDCVYEPLEDRWCLLAYAKENTAANNVTVAFEKSYSRTCPWLYPRYFKVPGETMGRGLIMLVMPTTKALNTATKLNLQAAAIAMLGIYTAIDDGVFSADNAPITPGAFWKVARNGGVLGPSVQRFPDPRIDLSQIILRDLRLDVQAGMNDQQLPPDTAAVKSPTEIMERVKRLASDHIGAFGRLVMEIMVPAVRRVIEIAYDFGQIQTDVKIDRLLVDLQVSSPMALAREAEKVLRGLRYIEIAAGVTNGRPERYVKLDVVMPEIATSMAIPMRWRTTEAERKQMDEAQAAAAAAAAAVATQDPKALEDVAAAA